MVVVVMAVGARIGHPEPDIVADVTDDDIIEVEVEGDEPLGEVAMFTPDYEGACVQTGSRAVSPRRPRRSTRPTTGNRSGL